MKKGSRTQRRFEQAFALHRQGRPREALAIYDEVLAFDPEHAPSLHYAALVLYDAGRLDEAIARIERSLRSDPGVSDTWSNAGSMYGSAGRHTDAVRAFERAIAIEATLDVALVNLASSRIALGDAVGGEAAARQAFALRASKAASLNLAIALSDQGRHAEALTALDPLRSGATATGDPMIDGLAAQSLIAVGRRSEAGVALDAAIARTDHPTLRVERARLAEADGDHDAAIDDCTAALGLAPDDETILSELIFLKKRAASWDGLASLQRAFRDRVGAQAIAGEGSLLTPFSFLSDPSSRAEQRVAAEAWSRRFPRRVAPTRPLSAGRLRVGYLSADLHEHATGVLAAGLFERHDRGGFEVFGYSTGPDDGSGLRRRLVAGFDRFVDAAGWSAERIASAIAADGVDILVDLKGHTERAETAVMAWRPAPIAVSYLGYPGTSGASFVDYLIGDPTVTPLPEAGDYTETLVLLPDSYQVNDDRRVVGQTTPRDGLGLPDGAVVFCCFCQTYKITPDVFDAWCAILAAVPGSVLWLLSRGHEPGLRGRLRHEATARGIDGTRIVFAATRPHAAYLGLYRHADLFLDTWPYNAHTTAADALWSGCPLLTFEGTTFAGRVAASALRAAGMPEGIASDRADYVARAIAWGNDRDALAAWRRRVAGVRDSTLFDTGRTTRAIEAAYRAMATQYRAGRREPIVVASLPDRRPAEPVDQSDGADGCAGVD